MKDWKKWHEGYDDPNSSLARRLAAVRRRIAEALDGFPAGPIRVISMCAGDGRDLLSVLQTHPRAGDVSGRLVELDERLADLARAAAPAGIEVVRADAGSSDAYAGAAPANLLMCCGVFGNISDKDIQKTLKSLPMLCASGAIFMWTRGSGWGDQREAIRRWVSLAGFKELSFDGADDEYGVGVAQMVRAAEPYRRGVRFFSFMDRAKKKNRSLFGILTRRNNP